MNTKITVAVLLAASLALPGCYKSQYEEEKKKSDQAAATLAAKETELNTLKGQISAARADAAKAQADAARFRDGAVLVTLSNGQRVGTDQVRLNENGEFVRHGNRVRSTSTVRFDNGRLADQVMTVNRENGKPNFTGAVKNSRPDGDWIWFDKDGKPATKEVWKDGKLAEIATGQGMKNNQAVWKTGTKAERDSWFKQTIPVFANLPELTRELATETKPAADPAKPAAGTTPVKPAATTAKPAAGTTAKPK